MQTRVRSFSSLARMAQQQLSPAFKEPVVHHSPPSPPRSSFNADSNLHFYRNKILDEYVQQQTTPITLRQLLFYERQLNTERLLKSANYVRRELPIRISHRIREFQKLPFIVGTNPHIQSVYDIYWQAFERLRKVPPIETLHDNEAFCGMLAKSLQSHMVAIPRLALGISECGQHIEPDRIDRFMHATLRSRVSRRVLAEQHLALSQQLRPHDASVPHDTVFSSCSAKHIVRQCVDLARAHSAGCNVPEVVVDGHDVSFTYIFDHIEYVVYQLLSNAFRHTIAKHPHTPPPIKVTICSNDQDVLFRVSDQGGGMPQNIYSKIWSYGQRPHARFGNFRNVSQLAARIAEHDQVTIPLGIGLPMSRVYVEYWGGQLQVVTMEGWGTDAYIRIPRFGTQIENLEMEGQEDEGWPASNRRFVV